MTIIAFCLNFWRSYLHLNYCPHLCCSLGLHQGYIVILVLLVQFPLKLKGFLFFFFFKMAHSEKYIHWNGYISLPAALPIKGFTSADQLFMFNTNFMFITLALYQMNYIRILQLHWCTIYNAVLCRCQDQGQKVRMTDLDI